MENTMKQFEKIIELQLKRIEAMKKQNDFVDYKALPKIVIGVCGGDGRPEFMRRPFLFVVHGNGIAQKIANVYRRARIRTDQCQMENRDRISQKL